MVYAPENGAMRRIAGRLSAGNWVMFDWFV